MRMDLAQIIKCDGEIRHFNYELDFADELSDGSHFDGSVHVNGSIKNFSGALVLSLSAKAILSTFCDRCLESIKLPVDVSGEFQISFDETDEADFIEAVDGIIDIDLTVRENLLLSMPMKRLCSEECKGLCPVCGSNLNFKICRCKKKDIDPRLEALKDLID